MVMGFQFYKNGNKHKAYGIHLAIEELSFRVSGSQALGEQSELPIEVPWREGSVNVRAHNNYDDMLG